MSGQTINEYSETTAFDEEYTALKVSNDTYLTTTIEAIVVELSVRVKKLDEQSAYRHTNGDMYQTKTKSIRALSVEKAREQNPHSRCVYDYSIDGYNSTPYVLLSHPVEDTSICIPLDVSEVIQFLNFDGGLEAQPEQAETTVQIKLDGEKCHIKSLGTYECASLNESWCKLEELDEYIAELEDQDGEHGRRQAIEYRESKNAVNAFKRELRKEWAKANDCYEGYATIIDISDDDDLEGASSVTIDVPNTNDEISFTMTPPNEWDEDDPRVRFVEEVGNGLLQNTENKDCYISLDDYSTADELAQTDAGYYIYPTKPDPPTDSDFDSEPTSRLARIRSRLPL